MCDSNTCKKCGVICVFGLINPDTNLCIDCDTINKPGNFWYSKWEKI